MIGEPSITLSKDLLTAWEEAVLAVAKMPAGTSRTKTPRPQLFTKLVNQETSAISQLWHVFTQERSSLGKNLLADKKSIAAYLLGFHLVNAARMQLLMKRAEYRHDFSNTWCKTATPWVWHDLGAGTGAMAQWMVHHLAASGFPLERLTLQLTENLGGLLDAARAALAAGPQGYQLKTLRSGLEDLRFEEPLPGVGYGYSLGYVWNELTRNRRAISNLKDRFLLHAKRGDRALIALLEPGMEEQSKGAMELRDELTAAGYIALYPCPTSDACPMRATTSDWCYSEGVFNAPPTVKMVDKKLGMDRSKLSGSMFLFATKPLAKQLTPRGMPPKAIVVGRPLKRTVRDKKQVGFDYLLCSPGGLNKIPDTAGKNFRLRGTVLND